METAVKEVTNDVTVKFLSHAEMAKELGLAPSNISRLVKNGVLHQEGEGRMVSYPLDKINRALIEFYKERRKGYTMAQIAEMLQWSHSFVRTIINKNLLKAEVLPGYNKRRMLYVTAEELDRFIDKEVIYLEAENRYELKTRTWDKPRGNTLGTKYKSNSKIILGNKDFQEVLAKNKPKETIPPDAKVQDGDIGIKTIQQARVAFDAACIDFIVAAKAAGIGVEIEIKLKS